MRSVILILVLVFAAPAARADATIYSCQMTPNNTRPGPSVWVSEKMTFIVNRETARAAVVDNLTMFIHKKALEVTYEEMSGSKLRLSWSHANVPTAGSSSGTIDYSVVLDDKLLIARLLISFSDAPDQPRATGECRVDA